MADGSIKITIEVDGKQVNVASKELDNLGAAGQKSGQGAKNAEEGLKGINRESSNATGGIKKFVTSLGLVAIGAAAFKILSASLDSAISRFDTLNKFPKVLQSLGVSAEDSERAIGRLSDGIDGLPTKLNDIAANAQRMYTSFNDMDKATDTALALNNALLGSGSSAADAQRGTEQYLQVLQKGKFEMEEWKTLQETMEVGLVKVAEAFGFTGNAAKMDLYDALKDGVITVDQFNDKLIELGTGTGELVNLAKVSSLGLATSLENLKNAAARGIADIIASFNRLSEKATGKELAEHIDSLKVIVNTSFKVIGKTIEGAIPIVKGFGSAVGATIPVVKALTPVIVGLVAAYGAYMIIEKARAVIEKSNAILNVAMTSAKALTIATQGQMAAQIASTTATKADIVAQAAQTGAVKLSTLAIGVLTGGISAKTAVETISAAASYALGAAIQFMLGPIGWVTAGIGLLVTGVIALVKWFNRSTKEGKKLNAQTEELASSTKELNEAVESSSKAYEKNQEKIKTNAKANAELVTKIDELAKKENKSAADKKLLNSYIDELNGSVAGLNLVYGEQSDALSMTSEQMLNRINLMKEEEQLQASQERLTEIVREQIEVETQLAEVNALREEWNQKLEEGTVTGREYKKAIKELEEQEASLSEANKLATEERLKADQQIIESSEAVAAAAEKDTGRQMLLFDELSKSQQETVESMKSSWEDYKEKATDMFDTLSEKSEISVNDMTKNLEENQRIITNWSENIAKLAERGIDEGLLETLREAGPSSAGHVNALVKASDSELQKLSDAFAKGGDVATEALSKSLGIEESGVMESVGYLVVSTEQALKEQIESADFKGLGIDIAKGQAGGIKEGTPEAEKAAKNMAKATEDAARKESETHSPSKAFERIGKDLTEGMELGISNGTAKVIQSAKNLSKSAIDQFSNIRSDFNSIGKNAMSGLNQGLLAGRSRVLSTARSIANSVASTMQRALRIKSPSRVMKDDVGRWIPEGLALGIKDNAKSVYRELDKLSTNMVMATPEQALGTSRMAYAGASNIINDYSRATVTKSTNINMDGLISAINRLANRDVVVDINGREIVRQTANDMSIELNALKKGAARAKGVRTT